MAWKPDLESLFNDEVVIDNINNTFLQKEKYFPPRPREHIEFALAKDKLREEKEKDKEKKDEREQMDKKTKNKENDDKKENEERKKQDIKKSKDRTFIFKLFDEYSKKSKHRSSLNTALPDILPEFPDLTLNEEKVVAAKEHYDSREIENEMIQMMRTLGMGFGRASYLDANRTISTHPIPSCIILPTSQYGIPILMDENFFKFTNTAKKENCPESVSDTNLLNSFEFKKRSFEDDPFAKAILENTRDDLNGKEAKEQYINHFPFLENTTSKVCNPERASESASAPFKKNKRQRRRKKNKVISQKPNVESTKVKK